MKMIGIVIHLIMLFSFIIWMTFQINNFMVPVNISRNQHFQILKPLNFTTTAEIRIRLLKPSKTASIAIGIFSENEISQFLNHGTFPKNFTNKSIIEIHSDKGWTEWKKYNAENLLKFICVFLGDRDVSGDKNYNLEFEFSPNWVEIVNNIIYAKIPYINIGILVFFIVTVILNFANKSMLFAVLLPIGISCILQIISSFLGYFNITSYQYIEHLGFFGFVGNALLLDLKMKNKLRFSLILFAIWIACFNNPLQIAISIIGLIISSNLMIKQAKGEERELIFGIIFIQLCYITLRFCELFFSNILQTANIIYTGIFISWYCITIWAHPLAPVY